MDFEKKSHYHEWTSSLKRATLSLEPYGEAFAAHADDGQLYLLSYFLLRLVQDLGDPASARQPGLTLTSTEAPLHNASKYLRQRDLQSLPPSIAVYLLRHYAVDYRLTTNFQDLDSSKASRTCSEVLITSSWSLSWLTCHNIHRLKFLL